MPSQKNIAIEFLKFFAVFLVINSHADIMYVRFNLLATGGAIGDCLFLFVSGFTLFLAKPRRFDNYYKRRISRIFPSVIAALIFIRLLHPTRAFTLLDLAGGEFIVALMLYYVLLFFIRKYAINNIPLIIAAVSIITLAVYIFFFPYKYETGINGIYGITTLFRWIPFLNFMLVGAWLGWRKTNHLDNYRPAPLRDFILMIISISLFYGIQFAAKLNHSFASWQILSLIPLMGTIYYMYRWCEAPIFNRLYSHPHFGRFISAIAGLCLESYLIQFSIITDKLNGLWPFNLLIITCAILLSSYLVRSFARFISQSFSPNDYDWAAIFRL